VKSPHKTWVFIDTRSGNSRTNRVENLNRSCRRHVIRGRRHAPKRAMPTTNSERDGWGGPTKAPAFAK
jgi:hypothetical protein